MKLQIFLWMFSLNQSSHFTMNTKWPMWEMFWWGWTVRAPPNCQTKFLVKLVLWIWLSWSLILTALNFSRAHWWSKCLLRNYTFCLTIPSLSSCQGWPISSLLFTIGMLNATITITIQSEPIIIMISNILIIQIYHIISITDNRPQKLSLIW